MSRLLKFRCFYRGIMYPVKEMQFEDDDSFSVSIIEMDLDDLGVRDVSPDSEHIEGIMQFTGLHDKNEKEIYEGDIFRVEEQADDRMYYLVIHWIKEWCMFGCLTVGEYTDYLATGISALDEPMFWTYTLEDTDSQKFFLCGNIYQNPKLLEL